MSSARSTTRPGPAQSSASANRSSQRQAPYASRSSLNDNDGPAGSHAMLPVSRRIASGPGSSAANPVAIDVSPKHWAVKIEPGLEEPEIQTPDKGIKRLTLTDGRRLTAKEEAGCLETLRITMLNVLTVRERAKLFGKTIQAAPVPGLTEQDLIELLHRVVLRTDASVVHERDETEASDDWEH